MNELPLRSYIPNYSDIFEKIKSQMKIHKKFPLSFVDSSFTNSRSLADCDELHINSDMVMQSKSENHPRGALW